VICDDVNYDDDDDDDVHSQSHMSSSGDQVQTLCVCVCVCVRACFPKLESVCHRVSILCVLIFLMRI